MVEFQIVFSLQNATEGITKSPYFNSDLTTVIISHGYAADSEAADIVQMAKDIKSLGTSNVLIYDHSALTKENYILATTNVQYAGEALGMLLANLYSRESKLN